MKRKLIRIMYVVTPVMLVLLLALNVFTILKVKALEESAGGDKTEDVAQENDVTIGGEYVIKETTQISDAYKSGNTSNLSDKDKETLGMAKSVLDEIITDGMRAGKFQISRWIRVEIFSVFLAIDYTEKAHVETVVADGGNFRFGPFDSNF